MNCDSDVKIIKYTTDMPIDYHVWDAMLELTQPKKHFKADQHHTEMKDRFVDNAELFASQVY